MQYFLRHDIRLPEIEFPRNNQKSNQQAGNYDAKGEPQYGKILNSNNPMIMDGDRDVTTSIASRGVHNIFKAIDPKTKIVFAETHSGSTIAGVPYSYTSYSAEGPSSNETLSAATRTEQDGSKVLVIAGKLKPNQTLAMIEERLRAQCNHPGSPYQFNSIEPKKDGSFEVILTPSLISLEKDIFNLPNVPNLPK